MVTVIHFLSYYAKLTSAPLHNPPLMYCIRITFIIIITVIRRLL